ncbi:MAG: type II toxin-antitoxin system RelE/ParE family toxin [Ignavibacteriae bacterium]|nr:type II toxin-antitoxin system RelE/ParE family toxin [Ignavibacteriota bacterium]
MRVGNYRIVYTVNTAEKIVMIERVRHRKDVYRKF